MVTINRYITGEVQVKFSLDSHDWCLLERSKEWKDFCRKIHEVENTHNPHEKKEGNNMSALEVKEIIEQQIRLLSDWNEKHIRCESEQVRKNIETILDCTSYLEETW